MPRKQIVLLDVEKQIAVDPFYYSAADAESDGYGLIHQTAWKISSQILKGGLSDGVMMVTLDNGLIAVDVVPTRGMGILRAKTGNVELGWNSPVGPMPVHPGFVNLHSRNKLGWIDGFNELFCRCGLSSNGPPGTDEGNPSPIESDLTLHGEIANRPAHHVFVTIDTNQETISVTGVVQESTLFGPQLQLTATIELKMEERSIRIYDEVTNLGSQPTEFELLYHCNIGSPFLEGGSTFLSAIEEVSPRDETAAHGIETWSEYRPPTAGYAEEVYYLNLKADAQGLATTLLKNAKSTLGFGVDFDRSIYPNFALWKNTQGNESGYCTGLEPAINLPNFKSFERDQGRVKILDPAEIWKGSLVLKTYLGESEVQSAEDRIETLQGSTPPKVHSKPLSNLSPN